VPILLTRPTALTPPVDDATRRDLLRGAGVLTLAGLLAACGGDSAGPDAGAPTADTSR